MKILKIEIAGATDEEYGKFISAIGIAKGLFENPKRVDISYSYKEESDSDPIPVTESTPFSRYLSSTTPEGRTE